MEVEVTWNRTIKVWWSYFWRNIVAIFCSMIIGGIIGGVIGFIMGSLGLSPELIQLVVMPIGVIIGLGISIVPLKMILGKDFGEFRLVLVKTTEDD